MTGKCYNQSVVCACGTEECLIERNFWVGLKAQAQLRKSEKGMALREGTLVKREKAE